MGHRKKSAPRRGSLAFRPRARAASLVCRVRQWPTAEETRLLGFAAYKVGMSYGFEVEQNQTSPNFGKEIFTPVTFLEAPPLTVCAVRAYEQSPNGVRTLSEVWSSKLPRDLERAVANPPKSEESVFQRLEENKARIHDVRVVVSTNPRKAGFGKKTPEVMEIAIGGKTAEEKIAYAKSMLGKEVDVASTFKEGQFVDVIAVTKGKGIAGPVKRFGVRILQNKSRKTVRGVGCIGPWHPALVMWTVPRAGQLGFASRVEFNKKILKIGSNPAEASPKGGFPRYGLIRSQYIVVKGSVPGPAKRLVRLRVAVRKPSAVEPPNVTIHLPGRWSS